MPLYFYFTIYKQKYIFIKFNYDSSEVLMI